jgi:hypothetical protein
MWLLCINKVFQEERFTILEARINLFGGHEQYFERPQCSKQLKVGSLHPFRLKMVITPKHVAVTD